MGIKRNVKAIIFKICILFLSLCTLIWFSIFSYGIMYYLYIPAVAHLKPIHLKYDMHCDNEETCRHPFDNITLIESREYEFLRGGQGYAIEIVLEMPESERNLNQGMFMIKLDMLDHYGGVITTSYRPAILHYRSPLFKIIYTFFCMPALLVGSLEEKQSMIVPLFEKYIEDSYRQAQYAYIEVQAQTVEVYSSTLRIHAQFTGLRYLMYYWPMISAIVGIGSHFFFMLTTIIFIWFRETMKFPVENQHPHLWQSMDIKKEVRKQTETFQKPVALSRDGASDKKSEFPNRMKREKADIENLPIYRDFSSSHDKQKKEKSTDKQEKEEYFDIEHWNMPFTN